MSIENCIEANTAAINNLSHLIGKLLEVAPDKTGGQSEPTQKALQAEIQEAEKPDNSGESVDLRGLFVQMGKVCGKQSQLDLLKEFGSAKLSNIDPAQHEAVIGVMRNMLAEAGDA